VADKEKGYELIQLIGAYKRIFLVPEGKEVLDDLRRLSAIDEQAGSDLTTNEMVYRNAMQDMYRYIEAMISED
jgi:hypothetical protein|tara:strand:+ start:338 stop:556 length:219 start_codon:yes stop_codon:yes gene_type:complete